MAIMLGLLLAACGPAAAAGDAERGEAGVPGAPKPVGKGARLETTFEG
jgi:hypothetical protein